MRRKVIIEAELVTKAGNRDVAFVPLTLDGIEVTHRTPSIVWVELAKEFTKSILKDATINKGREKPTDNSQESKA